MDNDYLPVGPVYYEIIEGERKKNLTAIVNYFGHKNELEAVRGVIKGVFVFERRGEYLVLENGDKARLDRIITINGKPGPAYDEYDGYSLACLDCSGGMD
jgi:hypothetical protein